MAVQVAIADSGNRSGLVRDLHNKALLETNPKARDEYYMKKKNIQAQKNRINTLEDRMARIESLLLQLLDRE